MCEEQYGEYAYLMLGCKGFMLLHTFLKGNLT